jgi:hypothetical protein
MTGRELRALLEYAFPRHVTSRPLYPQTCVAAEQSSAIIWLHRRYRRPLLLGLAPRVEFNGALDEWRRRRCQLRPSMGNNFRARARVALRSSASPPHPPHPPVAAFHASLTSLHLPPRQVNNPFAVDWPLLRSMSPAEQLLVSGALVCMFREIFVKSAPVRASGA